MAKGVIAKQNLINKIIKTIGTDYIGEYDKKYYFWSEENGEKIQIAISMTCPKNPVVEAPKEELDFENMGKDKEIYPSHFEPAEISLEEQEKVAELIRKLGL